MQRIKQTLARLTSSSRSTRSSKVSNGRQHDLERRKSTNLSRSESKSAGSSTTATTDTLAHMEGTDPSQRGLCFLFGEFNEDSDGADIILVHGVNGHRSKTWTKAGVCWPRDLLGQDMPGVRVISWGWSVNVNDPAVYTMLAEKSSFGDVLLADIMAFRKAHGGSERPLIFVGHDFGGVMVKQALATAAMSRIYGNGVHAELGDVYAKTIGVLFLGTPHVPVSGQTLGQTLAAAAHVAPQPPDPALLGWIESQSEIFIKMHEDFVLFTRDMPVVCVKEGRPIAGGKMIPRASSSYKGGMNLTVDSIQADHFDIARFASRTDPGYFQILGHLSKLSQGPILTDIEETRKQRNQEILNALYFEGMIEKEGRIKVDETFKTSYSEMLSATRPMSYYDWLVSKESIFWISGRSGSGKSTLMKYAFHDEESRRRMAQWGKGGKLMTASVYLDENGSHLQRSHEGILRTVLYQILSERHDLISVAFPGFFLGPWPPLAPFSTIVNLTQAFWGIFSHEASRLRLVVFIDGLDAYRSEVREGQYEETPSVSGSIPEEEGSDNSGEEDPRKPAARKWLEDSRREIAGLVGFMSDQAFTKFCVSSRELPTFVESFGGKPRLRVHTSSEEAIARYCANRLEQEVPYLADAKSLCLEVASKSNGHILYARLVMDMLLEGSIKAIRPTLNALPSRLGGSRGLYMHILQKLGPDQRQLATRVFQLMHRAQMPLNLITMAFAMEGHVNAAGELKILKANQTMTAEDLRRMCNHLQKRVEECCLQLVECEGDPLEAGNRVVFLHQTAKEFASRKDIWDKLIGESTPHSKFGIDTDLCLLSSYIRHIQCFPSLRLFIRVWPNTRTAILREAWLLIATALRYASRIDSELKGDPVRTMYYLQLMDELDSTCQHAWVTALQTYQPLLEDSEWTESKCPLLCRAHWAGFEPMETGKPPKRSDFFCLAMQANLVNYVSARLGSSLRADDDETKQAKLQTLLRIAVCPKADGISACAAQMTGYRDFHRDMPETVFLDILFRHGLSVSDSAGTKIWAKAVKGGSQYFARQSTDAMAQLMKTGGEGGYSGPSALGNNRERWVAAMKMLLACGADPSATVSSGGSNTNATRDDGSSIETKTAIEMIRETLQHGPEYAVELVQIESLASKSRR